MIEDMEFDIEKVESLDYDKLQHQLKYIFQSESDIVNFINFLKNVYKLVNLSNDKRHMTLIDLDYYKTQIQLFEKRVQYMLDKKKDEQLKAAIKKAKGCGEKITESVITYYSELSNALNGLEELHALALSWSNYMSDLYFLCKQTDNKLGGIN